MRLLALFLNLVADVLPSHTCLKPMFFHRTWFCYPTLILNIIVRCDVLSSGLLMFHHLCHDILLSYSRCFTITHLFEADVSPSHMFGIVLWFSISLLGVMSCHLVYWCFINFSMIPCYLIADVSPSRTCLKLMFRHCTCLLSYFDSQYHC